MHYFRKLHYPVTLDLCSFAVLGFENDGISITYKYGEISQLEYGNESSVF